VDSTDADKDTPPRGATATGDKSAARSSRKLNTETKKTVTDVGVCPVIRAHDLAGNVIETHEHKSEFKEP